MALKLAIDIGNTRIKTGIFEGKYLHELKIFEGNQYAELLEYIISKRPVEAAILSSVREIPMEIMSELFERYPFTILDQYTSVPLINNYKTPESLGTDRLAGVIGAAAIFPDHDILVINAGTCITYDFITYDRQYSGGGIAPGIKMRFKSLYTLTDQLPLIQESPVDFLIGASTEEAILSGVMNGVVAEVQGMIEKFRQNFPSLKVILSGGDAGYFEKQLKSDIFVALNIVLSGLNEILDHHAEI